MRIKNKKVLVYGLGDSGRSAIKLLQSHGAKVSFFDDDFKYAEYVGFERNPTEKGYDFVVVSPGVRMLGNKMLQEFEKRNVPIISELDLAYLFCKGKIVAVTGTNGKTTVCMLTNKILSTAGYKTFLCGNIGLPFSSICDRTTKDCVIVLEISSFQLELTSLLKPNIACVLNVRPDHLDRHGCFEEYRRVKGLIARNLERKDVLILNFDDDETKKMMLHKNHMFFSKFPLKKGVSVKRNQIYVNKKPFLSLNSIRLPGKFNLENVLASVSICSNFKKVTPQVVENAVSNFSPANHRMQLVGKIDGITFVDDSKATNVASTIACVDAFSDNPILLLMGGLGKDIDYDELFSKKYPIKKVICFGGDREKIFSQAVFRKIPAEKFEKFDDAVLNAKKSAKGGEYVLLSPACASFDEFQSYAERGDRFVELVLGSDDEK